MAVLLVLNVVPSMAQSTKNFEDSKSGLISPDGRWELENVHRNGDPPFQVVLKDRATGRSRKLYEYGRDASVIWSPDSRHFVIDDYAGSNFTETTIFSVAEGEPKIDVQEEIRQRGYAQPTHGHDYFGVSRWLDANRVVVFYWGHPDEPPARSFCECYVYVLNGSAAKCVHQPRSNDPEGLCARIAR